MSDTRDFAVNLARFTGFAGHYDRCRPGPPEDLAQLAAHATGQVRPRLVVDLGSGTGLSTRYWAPRADRVVGVEPTADMRQQARAGTTAANVEYSEGFSHRTGLPDHAADVVCCMQALHWMEPGSTFAEAVRILRPGGVFLSCDYDWPPVTASWEADAAFEACIETGRRLERERKVDAGLRHWPKSGHLERMQASGRFRQVREVVLHHWDDGDAERLVGLMLSQGYAVALLRAGSTEEELGLTRLRATAARTLGDQPRPFLWSARVRLGLA
ncbi:MAG: class I SAM-dependent methyltransferase [Verrucomicrobia bacterium]|nr:class I SAM-dependent methyltransferase [Verrucomicrobiota bacterium]